jgi:hypothetical protein
MQEVVKTKFVALIEHTSAGDDDENGLHAFDEAKHAAGSRIQRGTTRVTFLLLF